MKLKTLAMLTALLLAIPNLANAHDELMDQKPADGEVVEAGIISVELTFNNELIALGQGSGSEIMILNSSGMPMNNGCAQVEGSVAIAKVDLDQPGQYQVGWRAVSSDGHPISGVFNFEVVNTTGYVANPNYVFLECESAFEEPNLISPQEQEQPEFIYWLLWGSLGLVAVALVLFLRPGRNAKKRQSGEN